MAIRFHVGSLGLLLCACDSPSAQLADLRDRVVVVTMRGAGEPSSIDLFFAPTNDECQAVEQELTGVLGGHALTYLGQSETELADPKRCYLQFEGDGATIPDDGVVRIGDDSIEIVGTFELEAIEPRVATHPTWTFQRNVTESIMWSHPGDIVSPAVPPTILFDGTGQPNTFPITVVPPDTIAFTLPSAFPTGMFSAEVIAQATTVFSALDCVNARACTARPYRSFTHTVTIIQ